jgi:type IX secretion system PorP/SprF family membrane protein
MKTNLLIFLLLSVIVFRTHGQSDPIYAQYLNNPFILNPAYAGHTKNLNASVSFRKQWSGFDGSPETLNASAHTSLSGNKMGIGLIIVQDRIGVNRNSDVLATYAYRIDLGQQVLSFGLQAGVTNYRIDNSRLDVYDPNGMEFAENQSVLKSSFGAGLLLSGDRYLLGLSVPRMLKHKTSFGDEEVQFYRQHFYLTGAYTIFLSDRLRLKPSVLLKGVKGAPLSADYNVTIQADQKYSAGLYARNLNAYGLIAQLKLSDRYRLGYAFEVPTNKSVGARFTSHELTLGINLDVLDFHDSSGISSF